MSRETLEQLVRSYAAAELSDTFTAYNDAIRLAREVLRLRRRVRLLSKRKVQP